MVAQQKLKLVLLWKGRQASAVLNFFFFIYVQVHLSHLFLDGMDNTSYPKDKSLVTLFLFYPGKLHSKV